MFKKCNKINNLETLQISKQIIILTHMMKGNQGWNKLKEWERQKNYKQHVQRMKRLSSPKTRKRSKQEVLNSGASASDIVQFRKGHKVQQQRKMDIENERLIKKLSQIGRRKSNFAKLSRDQQSYYTINMRSRQINRKIKEEQIQQQNDLIVQRIIRMRSRKHLSSEYSFEQTEKKPLRKSRAKRRNASVILPKIQSTILDNAQQV